MRLLGLLSAIFIYFLLSPLALAASYESVLVRLDQTQVGVATSALVCTTPNVSGVENSLTLTFPSALSLSSNSSHWTISNTNLLTGATPWPSLGFTNVTGQVATFTSGDLTTGTLYCFRLSNTPLTVNQVGYDLNGSLATNLDSTFYAISTQNTQIVVTGTVPPNTTDLTTTLTSTVSAGILPQGQLIPFQIVYDNESSTDIDFQLTASWTLGTISGDYSPSVPVLEYFPNSATDGYQSAPPVIDSVNRTITWSISNMPAHTSLNVYFSLYTTAAYTGGNQVGFQVSSQATNSYISTVPSTLNFTYQYKCGSNCEGSGSTTSSGSSSSTSSSVTSTTPLPDILDLLFNLHMRTILSDSASFYLFLNLYNNLYLDLGTNLNKLSTRYTYLKDSPSAIFTIGSLNPDTTYYFQLRSLDGLFVSDYYSFHTAKAGLPPTISADSIIVSSGGDHLLAPLRKIGSTARQILIPRNVTFDSDFLVPPDRPIKEILVLIRPINSSQNAPIAPSSSKVLGANSEQDLPTIVAKAVEIAPGRYTVKLRSIPRPGLYEVVAIISDYQNFRAEQLLYTIRVSHPIRILDSATRLPIEKAKLTVHLLTPTNQVLEEISSHFSNRLGEVDEVLPDGRYQARIQVLNYKPFIQNFVIDSTTQDALPEFSLDPLPFTILGRVQFYSREFTDLSSNTINFLRQLSNSNTLYVYFSETALYTFLLLTSFALLLRFGLSPFQLPTILLSHLSHRREERHLGHLLSSGKPLKRLEIVGYSDTGEQIFLTTTSNLGTFAIPPQAVVHLFVRLPNQEPIAIPRPILNQSYVVNIDTPHRVSAHFFHVVFDLLGGAFEVLLFLSLILQFFFLGIFEFTDIWPSILISGLNLIGWLVYHHHLISHRRVSRQIRDVS